MDERLSDKSRAVSTLQQTTEMARSDAAVLQMQHDNLRAALTDLEARYNVEAAEKAALAQKLADAQEAERQTAAKLEAVTQAQQQTDEELVKATAEKNAQEVENAGLSTRLQQVCVGQTVNESQRRVE